MIEENRLKRIFINFFNTYKNEHCSEAHIESVLDGILFALFEDRDKFIKQADHEMLRQSWLQVTEENRNLKKELSENRNRQHEIEQLQQHIKALNEDWHKSWSLVDNLRKHHLSVFSFTAQVAGAAMDRLKRGTRI
jgi:hypothetical protein